MSPPTVATLLDAWEQCLAEPPAQRAMTLLTAAYPGLDMRALTAAPIGVRDYYLLNLREWAFGRTVDAQAGCPACGEELEFSFTLNDIRVPMPAPTADMLALAVGGYEVRFRLPTSEDLLTLSPGDWARARVALLTNCLLAVDGPADSSGGELPEAVVDAVVAAMAEADPQADVTLALTCPACAHAWETVFDILAFCWAELTAWAYRTLHDIHTLAAAYGWREHEILALSPQRRQFYLAQVNG